MRFTAGIIPVAFIKLIIQYFESQSHRHRLMQYLKVRTTRLTDSVRLTMSSTFSVPFTAGSMISLLHPYSWSLQRRAVWITISQPCMASSKEFGSNKSALKTEFVLMIYLLDHTVLNFIFS